MSHKLTTSTKGDLVNCGRYWCDTLPQPITPVRMRLTPGSAAKPVKTPDATVAPAARVIWANFGRRGRRAFMLVKNDRFGPSVKTSDAQKRLLAGPTFLRNQPNGIFSPPLRPTAKASAD